MRNAEPRRIVIRTGDRDGWAWLEVEDSGPGVPPQDEAKLFQPFYTTKPVGEGTGPRPVGELRHHPVARRPHRLPPGSDLGGAIFYFELPIVPHAELDA